MKGTENWSGKLWAAIPAVLAQSASPTKLWVSALTSIRELMKPWARKRQWVGAERTSPPALHKGGTHGGWHPQGRGRQENILPPSTGRQWENAPVGQGVFSVTYTTLGVWKLRSQEINTISGSLSATALETWGPSGDTKLIWKELLLTSLKVPIDKALLKISSLFKLTNYMGKQSTNIRINM